MSAAPPRAVVTGAAASLLRHLADVHGPLMLHQSGGCCDGSAPMCFPMGEFTVGDRDVLLGVFDLSLGVGELGTIAPQDDDAVPLWISGPQFDAWKHTQLVLDVVPGRGAGFSLEAPEGVRLLSRGGCSTPPNSPRWTARSRCSVPTGNAARVPGRRRPRSWWPRPPTRARCRATVGDPARILGR